MSAAVAGIHFGNTNCVVAVCKDGKVQTVSNDTGDRVTPTIVAYTGNEKIIGQPAKQFLMRHPKSCITHIKNCVGDHFNEKGLEEMQKKCSCKISLNDGSISYQVRVEDDTINVSSTDAMSYIFTGLLEIAESFGGSDLEDAVIAVPYSFTDDQKNSICDAAESIGFNILRMISEPAAAALGYELGQEDPSLQCKFVVFRLGGSSTDASLVNVNSGIYKVIGQKRQPNFGANDFDDVLVKYLASEFKRKYKEDISQNIRCLAKLRTASEECKRTLSRSDNATCSVESLYDGIDFQMKIPRMKYESMCNQLFSRCMNLIEELLEEYEIDHSEIKKVLLIGGGTKIPKLMKCVKEKFPCTEFLHDIALDEIIARGAAMQAGLLNTETDRNSYTSSKIRCICKNIGVKVSDGEKDVLDIIIQKDSPVPMSKKKTFFVNKNQNSVKLPIYESSNNSLENSRLLAKLTIKDLTTTEEQKEMVLDIQVNESGNLVAAITDKTTGKSESITIDIEHLT